MFERLKIAIPYLLEAARRLWLSNVRGLPDEEKVFGVTTTAAELDQAVLRDIAGDYGRWIYLRAITGDVAVSRRGNPASINRGIRVRTSGSEKDFFLRPGEKLFAISTDDGAELVILYDSAQDGWPREVVPDGA